MAGSRYNTVSLFSGAMGLDLGIEHTGRFNLLACVEKERSFCETIRLNQRAGRLAESTRVFESDIWQLPPERVMEECGLRPGELDLLVGGPPCQSFSTAGRRGTTQDPARAAALAVPGVRRSDAAQVLRDRERARPRLRGIEASAARHETGTWRRAAGRRRGARICAEAARRRPSGLWDPPRTTWTVSR